MARSVWVLHTFKSKWLYFVKRLGSDLIFRGGLGNATAGTGYY